MENITFKLQKEVKSPLYQQLYHYIIGEMAAGRLREGEKLPSKRALCAHLGVSQSTVETAYGMLAAEGYLRAVPKSGYYVSAALEKTARPLPAPRQPAAREPDKKSWRYDFSTGAVDTSLFPYASWARISREVISRDPQLLQRGQAQGDAELRQTLAAFLREYRGVCCRAEQIVVGAGLEYLLSVLVQLLPEKSVFAVEDPGYGALWQTLRNHRRRMVPIPVDGGGMQAEALVKSRAQIAYVTPSHQFPMGSTMPVGRRSRLLQWAAAKPGRYLIEDDYDSEFRYASRPIPAMQGMDPEGRVIYIGTFSRSIAPGIRAAYLVLPEALLPVYGERFGFAASTVSRFEQQTLRLFLEQGLYGRHLRRMTLHYRKKQQLLTQELRRRFPGAELAGQEAGLHFLLMLPGQDGAAMAARCRAEGLPVRALSDYRMTPAAPEGALVLGFAGLRLEEIPAAAAALEAAIRKK